MNVVEERYFSDVIFLKVSDEEVRGDTQICSLGWGLTKWMNIFLGPVIIISVLSSFM